MVKLLANAGPELDLCRDPDGATPLMAAAMRGHLGVDVCRILLDAGADRSIVDAAAQLRTAQDLAIERAMRMWWGCLQRNSLKITMP